MNIKEILAVSIKELGRSETSEPESSARVLLGAVLNMTRTELLTELNKKVTKKQEEKFKKYIERRQKHESVWHIIGRVPFWGMEFLITKDVLVPRPETEMLVETVVNHILSNPQLTTNDKRPMTLLDVGTGSGAIAIALANEFPEIDITASDISEEALKVAKKNAKELKIAKSIKFIKSDLFNNIEDNFDIITANLPYVPSEKMKSLQKDVCHYEPKLALDGGIEGLEIYDRFFEQVEGYLSQNGIIFCEIGHNMGKKVCERAHTFLLGCKSRVIKDFANIDRIVIIRR